MMSSAAGESGDARRRGDLGSGLGLGLGLGGGAEGVGEGGIRPRNRRVGGLAAGGGEQELGTTSRSSATSTPGGSRGNSPLPAKHPSRRTGRSPENAVRGDGKRNGSRGGGGGLLEPPSKGGSGRNSPVLGGGGFAGAFSGLGLGKGVEGGLMSSWNALQELAREVLGSGEDNGGENTRSNEAFGKGKRKDVRPTPRKLPEKWGPSTTKKLDDAIGEGGSAAAEREAKVRAKRMTRVLEGRDDPIETRDTNGKFKLRTSSDEPRPGSPQEDENALVYIHPVQKNDTLQGVVLRYNCKPDVFRKANRFWPNDSIQIRKTVVLPVDACAIKGRPCEAPNADSPGVDLLASTPLYEDTPMVNGGGSTSVAEILGHGGIGTSAERPDPSLDDNENPWIHVRWVLLDASPNSRPVEIARMPRKTLGYFPPRRRKSQNTLSTVSTPRASLDFPASTMSPALSNISDANGASATPGRRAVSNLGLHSTPGSYFPPSPMTAPRTRPRRESVGEAADRLGWMRGPGGVGTMSVRKPGPGNDGLNLWARKHFKGIAIDELPSTSILGAEQAHFGFSAESEIPNIAERVGRRGGLENVEGIGGQGQGMGLENAAAKIEGWVRRVVERAGQVQVPGTPKGRVQGEGPDLIELLDGTGSDDGRGFELSPASGKIRAATPVGTGREDLDGLVRGRDRAGGKGGKGD